MTTALDQTYLTVPELAALLRIKERKVYDLAASGAVPCSRATGKLLFPRSEVEVWLTSRAAGGKTRRPQVFLGSHDPLLEWALRQSECGLATYFQSSRDGLDRFVAEGGVATGLHLEGEDGVWNMGAVTPVAQGLDAALVAWAGRERGLAIRKAEAASIKGPEDLAGRRLARRQEGAGAEEIWSRLLSRSAVGADQIALCPPSLSEQDAVLSVVQGDADAAFGLRSVALAFGLAFVPLIEERFDILLSRRDWFDPPLQKLHHFTQGAEFRAQAAKLGGYCLERTGEVLWNA